MGANIDDVSAALFDKEITDYSIDSRSVKAGELFFALSQKDYSRAGFNGAFADAHQYLAAAFAAGALAAVVRADHLGGEFPNYELDGFRDRFLVVDDVIAALQTLAHQVYSAWSRPVV